jgi:hypothetical protein
MAHLLGHGRKSNTFWQIWERVNKTSFLNITMVERAAVTEFTSTSVLPVFAGNGLVIRVDSS